MIGFQIGATRRRYPRVQGGPADVTPPVLSGLLVDEAQGRFDVSSSEMGALHWLIDSTASHADADALVAAKPAGEASGAGLAMSGTTTVTYESSGVPAGAWRLHVGVIDSSGNASNVLSADLTMSAAGIAWNGDPLEWNGDQLIFNAA